MERTVIVSVIRTSDGYCCSTSVLLLSGAIVPGTVGFDCSFAYETLVQEVPRQGTVEAGLRWVRGFFRGEPSTLRSGVVVHHAVGAVELLSFSSFSSSSTSSTALPATTTAPTATTPATPSMCKEAVSCWGCGRAGVAFVRIVLLLSDCNPPYRCVDVGSWVLHLHKLDRRLEL